MVKLVLSKLSICTKLPNQPGQSWPTRKTGVCLSCAGGVSFFVSVYVRVSFAFYLDLSTAEENDNGNEIVPGSGGRVCDKKRQVLIRDEGVLTYKPVWKQGGYHQKLIEAEREEKKKR
ncbi:hypothetical protein P168DRAFT_13751 [Aspergillus campestris IBT 28561]|uniref:Uncharacterized protein n=1 Tax=Aspergillus campestris (strain IBT 28561) TaxID=1392248 RepID=A0A2I1DEM0_ASPC2|nr:uncharacterized protein P168DRAFT_13751 [Aspergillus campestris IBT 28561]PKY08314.1 hypothetical protein P168DRAFT_13751 [Aspergillus campestris IBT 28561]